MRENLYQAKIIKKLKVLLPGCMILKNDPSYQQGVPDLIILFLGRWGALEVKRGLNVKIGPNQRHFVERMNKMSFAAFISPENEEKVLNELQRALSPRGKARLSQPK